mmetsp:Transcript_50973/g.75633  ORF Transcript_50973/g.75633 Transcript_50973/m.75633 type:complete len:348 (-) Transcript_50973:116-1159(-)
MPRGWLKNQTTSLKLRRGGGSKIDRRSRCTSRTSFTVLAEEEKDEEYGANKIQSFTTNIRTKQRTTTTNCRDRARINYDKDEKLWDMDDFYNVSSEVTTRDNCYFWDEQENNKEQEQGVVEVLCPICFETRHTPLMPLVKNCNHPPAACRECLREIYIHQAPQNVSNYPLRCYYPSCDRRVRETQLIHHDLIESNAELAKYRRLVLIAKANRNRGMYVYCPNCDLPHSMKKFSNSRCWPRVMSCKQCNTEFLYEKGGGQCSKEDLLALKQLFQQEEEAIIQCKRCYMLVTKKKGGCDKVKCRCGYRICFVCGSENAQCRCTPMNHGFIDNFTGLGDFSGLRASKSPT